MCCFCSFLIHPSLLQLLVQYNQHLSVQRNHIFKNMDISYTYTLLVGVTRLLGNFVDAVKRLKEMTMCSCMWMDDAMLIDLF